VAQNIVITGFMGTGKTTVSRLVAEKLDRKLVDMDAALVERFGKPIADVFADDGEAAFRDGEAKLSAELAKETDLVISTGGGTLVFADADGGRAVSAKNAAALGETGIVIRLTANIDSIMDRIADTTDRPLLEAEAQEKRTKTEALLASRKAAYEALPHHVSTNGRTPVQVADAIVELLPIADRAPKLRSISVHAPYGGGRTGYPILVADGLLESVGALLGDWGQKPGPIVVVSNPEISGPHGPRLMAGLEQAGFTPTLFDVPAGEQHKTGATVASIYDAFLDAKLHRRSCAIALGGGVVGDMTGFAAASYLRGMEYVQIPTTIVAMVDSSVGGKTGYDLPQGKNLVGAFKQPLGVVVDPTVLDTLPVEELRAGLAEVVKHAIIDAPPLFDLLEGGIPDDRGGFVLDAVQVKVNVVEGDPFERGWRAVLNLGHTFGHAIERESGYALRHGEAVGLGLISAAHMAEKMGRAAEGLTARTKKLLEILGLPVRVDGYDVDQVHDAMAHDKKRGGKGLRFIIPEGIGKVAIIDDPGADLVKAALRQVI